MGKSSLKNLGSFPLLFTAASTRKAFWPWRWRSSMIIVDKSVIIIIIFMKMIFVAESVEDAASVQSASVGGLNLLLARIFIIVTITSTMSSSMSPPSHHQSHYQCHYHHIVNVIIINVNINNGIITIPLLDWRCKSLSGNLFNEKV